MALYDNAELWKTAYTADQNYVATQTDARGDGDERRLRRIKRIAVPMRHRVPQAAAQWNDNAELWISGHQ